jgi:acyl-CoA reductase-like NAD-dependent aldehyde dehydrogenase
MPRPSQDHGYPRHNTIRARHQRTDPATGEVTETFPFATDAEVAEALAAATEAFAAWRLRPVAERAAVVKSIAGLFTGRAADLAALITREMGAARAGHRRGRVLHRHFQLLRRQRPPAHRRQAAARP